MTDAFELAASAAIADEFGPLIDGETYHPERDGERLVSQFQRVFDLMKDGEWRTLPEIASLTKSSPQAVSARLRDFRKPRFGAHEVKRKYLGVGLWEYQLVMKP